MNIPCDLILDLLPLYHNNLCSEGSETIIAEHLQTCEKCNQILKKMDEVVDIPPHQVDEAYTKVLNAFS